MLARAKQIQQILVFYSDAFLTKQVLIERYLTSLLFVHQLT